MVLHRHEGLVGVGELDRVADEVGKDLLEPQVVGDEAFRESFADGCREPDPAGVGVVLVDEEDFPLESLQLEGAWLQSHPLGR